MRVAVTGATGFLGSHIARALRAGGLDVRAAVRRTEGPDAALLTGAGITLAHADLEAPASLAAAFAGCDVVVANAALGSFLGDLDAFVRTNVGGTENTLRSAAAAGVRRVVYLSSVAIYRTSVRDVMDEDYPRYGPRRRTFSWTHLTTDWRYAVTKQAAEERAWALAEDLGIALTVLRPGPVYGSRDRRWTGRLLRLVERPVAVFADVGVPAVHAGDVATAVLRAVERPAAAGRAYNLAAPPARMSALLATLARLRGDRPVLLPVPLPLRVRYDTRAAEAALGFAARPYAEGLAEVVDENRAAGWDPGAAPGSGHPRPRE